MNMNSLLSVALQMTEGEYIQKGGVLKTSTSFNEARIFALHGLKTLIIGLDFECSITDVVLGSEEVTDLDQVGTTKGLYHFLVDKVPLKKIIRNTSLPTLDIIPETHDLVLLNKWIDRQNRREYMFKDKLLPSLKKYDVIIFDNGPSWNLLIENAITAADVILSPLGCNYLAYKASQTNFNTLIDFQEAMKLKQKNLLFPTLLDRTTISQQIYGQYLSLYKDYIIPIPIRSSVKGQESLLCGQSVLEYEPGSALAGDYYDLMCFMWDVMNDRRDISEKISKEELEMEA
ncbi:Sporulation initiation inhibitor protein soj (plasmid) [Piscirickettsia salmonis]|uniref:ParA family protein n=2 Tax=Piscirickettsia salmonis TaxID=1238 RepID=UPI0012B83476|nr:ParA family protein [Piscirickettsia salmonis]QGP52120.1 Sporulation initiation inhibitor protein soj [Piscirickettsia salmonis]